MAGFTNSSLYAKTPNKAATPPAFARRPDFGGPPGPTLSAEGQQHYYRYMAPRPFPGYGAGVRFNDSAPAPFRPSGFGMDSGADPQSYFGHSQIGALSGVPPLMYAVSPSAGQPPSPAIKRAASITAPQYAQLPEPGNPPQPGYINARPLRGRDLSLSYAKRPAPGQPPQPAFAYAALPSMERPPQPAFAYTAQPDIGQPPMPMPSGVRLPSNYTQYAPQGQLPTAFKSPSVTPRGAFVSTAYSPSPVAAAPYGAINLPATALGPNQSTAAVRARIADRYDPQSFVNATTTPGEQQAAVASRAAGYSGALASSQRQNPYSPVAGVAAQDAIDAAYARQAAAQDARFQQGRQLQAQNDAKLAAAGIDPQAYRAAWSNESAQYANYAQRARDAGQRAMTYEQWRGAGGAQGSQHQELADANANYQAMQNQQPRVAQPNYQASAYLAQRYGVPAAMPNDPVAAQNWMQSMAMSGNPYAASAYRQQIEQQGQNLRNLNDNLARSSGYQAQVDAAKAEADARMYGADRQYDAAQLGVDAEESRYKREEAQRKDAREREDLAAVQSHLGNVMQQARSTPGAGEQEVQAARLQALRDWRQTHGSLPPQLQQELDAANAAPANSAPAGDGRVAVTPASRAAAAENADMSAGGLEQAHSLANSLAANNIPVTREHVLDVAQGTPLAASLRDPAKVAEMYRGLLEREKEAGDQYASDNTPTTENIQALTVNPMKLAERALRVGRFGDRVKEGKSKFRSENDAAFKMFESLMSPEDRQRIEKTVNVY